MSSSNVAALKSVIERGIGTQVVVQLDSSGARPGLSCHFSGLTQNQGPVCSIYPSGLFRHLVHLRFGKFAGECVEQMQRADEESYVVARALVESVAGLGKLKVEPDQADWRIDASFQVTVEVGSISTPAEEESLARTAGAVMVPLMAAMAELIGYDEVESDHFNFHPDIEGQLSEVTILRRERSRRNRLLCLSVHGEICVVCGFSPRETYGDAGAIIQVHHLMPLGLISSPQAYNPVTDLVPLCPNCHCAAHTRRPIPYSVNELKSLLAHVYR